MDNLGKLLKHCPTRWLSLHKCVKRTVLHWPALKSYFASHPEVEKVGSRVQRCSSKLNDVILYMTYLFLDHILEPILGFNTAFQADESMVGYLHTEMKRFLKTVLCKFVKMKVVKDSANVTEVDFYSPDNQHDNDNLAVSMGVRAYLCSNPDIDPKAVNTFFQYAREFYIELTERVVKKFPFQDKVLMSLAFLNPDLRCDVSPFSVAQPSQKFTPEVSSQRVADEYEDFCAAESGELPEFEYGVTPLWHRHSLSKLTIPTGQRRYASLCTVACACLSLPHSNADTERCFSRVTECCACSNRTKVKQKALILCLLYL